MNYSSPQIIVDQVLRNDMDPPSDEYSPYDFGAHIARHISEDVAKDVVRKSFEILPGTLAASFLEGFLQNVALHQLDTLLLEALLHSREIGAGGAIVEFLQNFCGLSADDIARRILVQLSATRDGNEQNRLSYALWCLICGETYEIASGNLRQAPDIRVDECINNVLTTMLLTDYAKTTLEECLGRTRKKR